MPSTIAEEEYFLPGTLKMLDFGFPVVEDEGDASEVLLPVSEALLPASEALLPVSESLLSVAVSSGEDSSLFWNVLFSVSSRISATSLSGVTVEKDSTVVVSASWERHTCMPEMRNSTVRERRHFEAQRNILESIWCLLLWSLTFGPYNEGCTGDFPRYL